VVATQCSSTCVEHADLTAVQVAEFADLSAEEDADLSAVEDADLSAVEVADLSAVEVADLSALEVADLITVEVADLMFFVELLADISDAVFRSVEHLLSTECDIKRPCGLDSAVLLSLASILFCDM
jgi:hypothetical protein